MSDATKFTDSITNIIFACDAGMGSSAMGASVLRNKVKKAGLSLPVTNSAINNLVDSKDTLIVTQEELYERAKSKAPNATFVTVSNFMDSPRYDEIIDSLTGLNSGEKSENKNVKNVHETDGNRINHIDDIIVVYKDNEGSANMGATILKKLLKDNNLSYAVEALPIKDALSKENSLLIVNKEDEQLVEPYKGKVVSVDNLVTTEKYDYIIQELKN